MENTLQGNARMFGRTSLLLRGLGWGLLGGLAGTLVMDLALMGVLFALGSPALTCFSVVGSTVAHFFSMHSVEATRTILMGIATHYIVGPVIGAIYGTAVARIKTLQVRTMKKSILLAVLYVEILSQPMLALTPILLKMTLPATLQWYGGSFVMHLMAGAVLGAVVGRGLRLQPSRESSPNWDYRRWSFANLLRMGHCAPAVMQTILDISSMDKEWLVKLSAGMPGGIGNSGCECGAYTSPLVMVGLRDGLRKVDQGLPVIFDEGHALCQSFLTCHKTLNCREIRGKDRFPYHCIAPVTRAPELFEAVRAGNHQDPIPVDRREGYSRLYAHLVENDFHCARAVFTQLGYSSSEYPELFDAVSAFIGGTAFMGRTCSAFTAGVMALGLRAGEIENSLPRVIRLLALMTFGGNAFDDRINKFNRSMNRGYRMSKWFKKEFGSTQCQAITGCDFSDMTGVSNYITGQQVANCRTIASKVAAKVQAMLDSSRSPEGEARPAV